MHFSTEEDAKLQTEYSKFGFLIRPAASSDAFKWIQHKTAEIAASALNVAKPKDSEMFLNQIHDLVSPASLNDFRLKVIQGLNSETEFRRMYFLLAKPYLEAIVGNELAMQQRINLSIQMPDDTSSLLPVHADTWSGDSPFEVVVWLPLVDCFGTKAMYLLPPDESAKFADEFSSRGGSSSESVFASIEKDVRWLEVKSGEVMVFDQSLPHGNRLNLESETRWSMNCRFKGVFTPYGDKKLGEFFEPITLRPASLRGMTYSLPKTK